MLSCAVGAFTRPKRKRCSQGSTDAISSVPGADIRNFKTILQKYPVRAFEKGPPCQCRLPPSQRRTQRAGRLGGCYQKIWRAAAGDNLCLRPGRGRHAVLLAPVYTHHLLLPMLTKTLLRRAALARRQALPAAEVAARSQQLCARLFRDFPVAEWQVVHLFLPLARRNEPDTWPIIRRIWATFPAVRLAVPVVQADGISLKSYALSPATLLLENRWGIPEPKADPIAELLPAAFDAVLVPLLVVDETGQRVGYGGGFYDRLLAQCRPGTPFIGLNVLNEPPLGRIADVLPTDVPLTACLTPGGVWRF